MNFDCSPVFEILDRLSAAVGESSRARTQTESSRVRIRSVKSRNESKDWQNFHLTTTPTGGRFSIGRTDAAPGHYPAKDGSQESIVVTDADVGHELKRRGLSWDHFHGDEHTAQNVIKAVHRRKGVSSKNESGGFPYDIRKKAERDRMSPEAVKNLREKTAGEIKAAMKGDPAVRSIFRKIAAKKGAVQGTYDEAYTRFRKTDEANTLIPPSGVAPHSSKKPAPDWQSDAEYLKGANIRQIRSQITPAGAASFIPKKKNEDSSDGGEAMTENPRGRRSSYRSGRREVIGFEGNPHNKNRRKVVHPDKSSLKSTSFRYRFSKSPTR